MALHVSFLQRRLAWIVNEDELRSFGFLINFTLYLTSVYLTYFSRLFLCGSKEQKNGMIQAREKK